MDDEMHEYHGSLHSEVLRYGGLSCICKASSRVLWLHLRNAQQAQANDFISASIRLAAIQLGRMWAIY